MKAITTITPNTLKVAFKVIPEERQDNAGSWTLDFFKEIEAVAEGYYVSVDPQINHNNLYFPMIDDHDLIAVRIFGFRCTQQ